MARRNDHSREELKELALTAGEQLIDEEGIHALSARKIAQRIGYSAGALYLVFTNLDDLCWHINGRTMAMLNTLLSAQIEQEKVNRPPQEALRLIAKTYLNFSAEWPNRWALMFEHHTPESIICPDWLIHAVNQLFGFVQAPLRQLAPNVNDESLQLAVRTLWCGVHGIAALSSRGKLFLEGDQTDALIDNLLTHYLTNWIQESTNEQFV
ncbi:Bacterial regulatory proteins, tetR family [Marinomonas spartinae]|uniref:Bacterial regulatory proteins, tetR family n=1 Tax=Marinomonas spartinae TaxID=1792290 RepID=A0A1A8TIL7_9GAMM|nr:TetR/AcrR family transcriptional regulator [Marinomonas spartinae]SBS26241.1 Bacterial regulatory proteins, tetR family [Marinomonas spartinae]SBS32597.1 Bacterial regulatory proteins, tetR family [Marinomonas spartinae]